MVRAFYYRLLALFLVVLSVSFLILLVAILPSYFLSSAKESIVEAKIEKQNSEPVPLPDQQTLSVIKDLDKKLGLIAQARADTFVVSQKVINTIILKKMPSIKITDISYENNTKDNALNAKKITIQGLAPSREVLLLFRKALEDNSLFKSVDLPISNFVKGSNIQFYLNLIPS